jgi:hypothetical protein
MPYSDQQLLDHLSALADTLGHPPSTADMNENGRYSSRTYINRWGSWSNALSLAGLDTRDVRKEIATQTLLDALDGLTESLGHPPRTLEVRSETPYHVQTYKERFGSLSAALEQADIPTYNIGYKRTREELLAELRRLDEDLGHAPSTTDMQAEGEYVYRTYIDRFGGWQEAVEAAGLDPETINYRLSTDELLNELRFLEEKLDKTPAKWDMSLHGRFSPAPYLLRWGKWKDVLEEVGMEPENAKQIPDQVLQADLRRVIATICEEPTWGQLNEHSSFSASTFYERFGSVEEAVRKATSPQTDS